MFQENILQCFRLIGTSKLLRKINRNHHAPLVVDRVHIEWACLPALHKRKDTPIFEHRELA